MIIFEKNYKTDVNGWNAFVNDTESFQPPADFMQKILKKLSYNLGYKDFYIQIEENDYKFFKFNWEPFQQ